VSFVNDPDMKVRKATGPVCTVGNYNKKEIACLLEQCTLIRLRVPRAAEIRMSCSIRNGLRSIYKTVTFTALC